MILTAENILDNDDRSEVFVEVPEWGGTVRLLELSGDDRDKFDTWVNNNRSEDGKANLTGMRALLVGLCLVDEKGKRLFSDDAIERKLGKKSGSVLGKLFEEASKLNGLSAEVHEEIAEDFGDAPSESSITD